MPSTMNRGMRMRPAWVVRSKTTDRYHQAAPFGLSFDALRSRIMGLEGPLRV